MANDLAAIMPKILARGLQTLRQKCIMPRIVNGDYSDEAKEKGDTIDVPIPTAISAVPVVPSATPPAGHDTTSTKVQVPLANWYQNDPFYLTDKDLVQIDVNKHFMPMQASEAIKSLCNIVNGTIHAEYKGVYGFIGTPGVTPFATGGAGVTSATDANVVLNQQLAPKTDRRMVLDFVAEGNALALPQFSDAEKIGSNTVKIEGEIGRKYGLDIYSDDGVVTHTAGTGAGYLINNGAGYPVDTSTVTVDTGAGTILVGDIVTFAGHTQTYAVTTALAANTFSFYPPLKAAVADNAAITVKASHKVNLVFHRDAFAFATRPLAASTADYEMGSKIISMQDPQTGLVLRLEVSRQHKRVAWEFDILWGVKLVRPELAVRLAG